MQHVPAVVPHVMSLLGSYIFVDVGNFDDNRAGWGMTIRNQQGILTFATCRSICAAGDPILAEVLVV